MLNFISHLGNANQSHNELDTATRTAIKKKTVTSTGKDTEKLEFLYVVCGNGKWYSHCGKVWQFLKRLNMGIY